MHNSHRDALDARSVATAMATALDRPLVIAWRPEPGGVLTVIGSRLEQGRTDAVTELLVDLVDQAGYGTSTINVAGDDEWTVELTTDAESRTVVVAMPGAVDAATIEPIARSLSTAILAVLAKRWWQAITESGPDMVLVISSSGYIHYVSPSVTEILGYRPDELIGTDGSHFVSPEQLPDLASVVDHHLEHPDEPLTAHGGPVRIQVRHLDGTWRWIETMTADRLDDPIVQGVVITCRDVTDLVNARLELEQQHDRLGFILDNSADIIALMRSDGTTEFVTPSVERLLGWSAEHFTSHSAFDLVHPDDLIPVSDSLGATLSEPGEHRTGRFRLRRIDDTWVWVEARAMIAPGRDDVVVISARDVSEEVEALATAEVSEARYERLVEGSPQAIAIHQDGEFVYANRAAATILGLDDPAQLVGVPVESMRLAPAEVSRQRTEATLRGEIVGPFETSVLRTDGTPLQIEVTNIPTMWNDRLAVQVIAVDISDRQRAEALLEHTTLHDPLTGLPNRRLLNDRLDQAVRRARRTGERSALLFLDLDKFKVVNDAIGHTVGDQLLLEVAQRLRHATRETDTVARFGGDEFVILSQDFAQDDNVTQLVERIHVVLSDPYLIDGRTLRLSASTGLVRITGTELRDELLSFAETAMYVAKDAGRNRWIVFDEALHARATDRLTIESDLHVSLDSGTGFAAHFQPEVKLGTRQVVGFEALIRWTTPHGGSLPPDRFLPIAADCGLMHRMGGFMVSSVSETIGRLRPEFSRAWIALNAAPEELEHPEFAGQVQAALESHHVTPSRLCIEITEHSIMRDPAGVEATLRPLRDIGVTIAIDDFGTGYSSLAYLARFHPDFIKIDRSFTSSVIEQPINRSIIEAIIHLAGPMGITTVAEGIETIEQADVLTELGCDIGQGWYFGRPAPSHDVT